MSTRTKKLSLNKLAEYLDAKPSRRAAIVRQQLAEEGYALQYYSLAQNSIRRVLAAQKPGKKFNSELLRIRTHGGWGPYPAALITNNANALIKIWATIQASDLMSENIVFRKPATPLDRQILGDVRVTNRFDLELVIQKRNTRYGGIKFYISKEHPLTDLSGPVLASMLFEAATKTNGSKFVDRSGVLVLDAFQGKIYKTPNSSKRLQAEAVAAAKEFSMHWDHLMDR